MSSLSPHGVSRPLAHCGLLVLAAAVVGCSTVPIDTGDSSPPSVTLEVKVDNTTLTVRCVGTNWSSSPQSASAQDTMTVRVSF